MKLAVVALLLSAVFHFGGARPDVSSVTVWNTFQDDAFTGGRETIYDKDGPTVISPEFEFVDFPLNFGSDEYGFYAIDVGVNYMTFVLLNNTGATNLVFPGGTYDRYYFTFDKPVAAAFLNEALTDISSRVEVLPPGYELDFANLFNFDIAVPEELENGGLLVEVIPGADLAELGQVISLAYTLEVDAKEAVVWNTFQEKHVTNGIETICDKQGPTPIDRGITFANFPKFKGSDAYGFYNITVGDYFLVFELINNTGASDNIVFLPSTYDRYYFEFSDVVSNVEQVPWLTDLHSSVELLPPGYEMTFHDEFDLNFGVPDRLENGGLRVQILPGADLSVLGRTITVAYSLGRPGVPQTARDNNRKDGHLRGNHEQRKRGQNNNGLHGYDHDNFREGDSN